jgi:hypothetical protein
MTIFCHFWLHAQDKSCNDHICIIGVLYYHHDSPFCGSPVCTRNVLNISVPLSTWYTLHPLLRVPVPHKRVSLTMALALLYILTTVGLGYYTFRILYWKIFASYLECHLCPLQHSCYEKPTVKIWDVTFLQQWKFRWWSVCETRWSCRHTSIMEESAAPVFRWRSPFISYNFMLHPIWSPCHHYVRK